MVASAGTTNTGAAILDGQRIQLIALDPVAPNPEICRSAIYMTRTGDYFLVAANQANTIAVQNDRGKSEFLLLAAIAAPAVDMGRLAAWPPPLRQLARAGLAFARRVGARCRWSDKERRRSPTQTVPTDLE